METTYLCPGDDNLMEKFFVIKPLHLFYYFCAIVISALSFLAPLNFCKNFCIFGALVSALGVDASCLLAFEWTFLGYSWNSSHAISL